MKDSHLKWPFLVIMVLLILNTSPAAARDTNVDIELELSGSFDFLLYEKIHFQLAGQVIEKNTGAPVSDATVTFEVKGPDHEMIMSGNMLEEIEGSGIYVYTAPETMKDMSLPKGIYLVYAQAVTLDGYETVDMIQFHIDPPGEISLEWVPMAGVGGVVLVIGIGSIWIRRRK